MAVKKIGSQNKDIKHFSANDLTDISGSNQLLLGTLLQTISRLENISLSDFCVLNADCPIGHDGYFYELGDEVKSTYEPIPEIDLPLSDGSVFHCAYHSIHGIKRMSMSGKVKEYDSSNSFSGSINGKYTIKYKNLKLTLWSFSATVLSSVPNLTYKHWYVIKKDDIPTYNKLIYIVDEHLANNRQDLVLIMDEDKKKAIIDNSVNWLLKCRDKKKEFAKYNFKTQRGILLYGSPGVGKTLICRYLYLLSTIHDLQFVTITTEQFDKARQDRKVKELLTAYTKPTIVFFDDVGIMDSRGQGHSDVCRILPYMDGTTPNEHIVYIFCTNSNMGIDPAFLRPGRIDVVLELSNPEERHRREFLSTWHKDILQFVDEDNFIRSTDGYSFAELEELRKQCCLSFIDTQTVNFDDILQMYHKTRELARKTTIGFLAVD